MKSPSEGFRNHVFTKREGTSLLVVVINTRTYPSIFLKNVELQLNRRCPAPPLGSEAHARASPSQLARGRGGALAGVCGAGVTAQRAHTGERGLTSPPWKGRATRTRAHTPALPLTLSTWMDPSASDAHSPSTGQASGTPIRSPIKRRLPHLTRRGQGPCPLTLVCQPG